MSPLFFIAGFTGRQLLNVHGSPFCGGVMNQLKQLELFDLFADVQSLDRVSYQTIRSAGPSGTSGVMIGIAPLDGQAPNIAFQPDVQEWQQVSTSVWVGSSDGKPPGAADLERHRCCVPATSMENVMLADGRVWEVPVIRQPIAGGQLLPVDSQPSKLPSSLYRDTNSEWQMQVVPKYRELWETSRSMFELFLNDEEVNLVQLMEYSVAVLGLRYRFNLLLHSRWPEQYLTTENVLSVALASVGWRIVERHIAEQNAGADVKKKADELS